MGAVEPDPALERSEVAGAVAELRIRPSVRPGLAARAKSASAGAGSGAAWPPCPMRHGESRGTGHAGRRDDADGRGRGRDPRHPRRRRGTPAPAPTIRSSATPSWPRWRTPAPPAPRPAGCRGTCCRRRRTAGASGCVPLYLKSHSYGEYVFDWGWAEAFERAGGRYYPKLQAAVPFTPVTGPRLLVRAGRARRHRRGAGRGDGRSWPSSSASPRCTSRSHGRRGRALVTRLASCPGSASSTTGRTRATAPSTTSSRALSSRKRKAIRKERAEVAGHRVRIRTLTGERDRAAALGRLPPLLSRHRRAQVGARLPEPRLLPPAGRDDGRAGGADRGRDARRRAGRRRAQPARRGRALRPLLGLRRPTTGSCTSRPATTAPSTSRSRTASPRVEAGAQGEHKIQRGYLPVATYSAHWIADPGFRKAVERFLDARTAGGRAGDRGACGCLALPPQRLLTLRLSVGTRRRYPCAARQAASTSPTSASRTSPGGAGGVPSTIAGNSTSIIPSRR